VRQALKWLGFSLEESRKLLNKANPKKAFGFLSRSHQSLMKAALDQDHLLVFIDEAHIHLIDEGYGWSIKGERFGLVLVLLDSKSPRSMGFICTTWEVCIWPYGRGNGDNTIDVLETATGYFSDRPMTVI
jgi:hypothetical protein